MRQEKRGVGMALAMEKEGKYGADGKIPAPEFCSGPADAAVKNKRLPARVRHEA